jgi:hypothetical protein
VMVGPHLIAAPRRDREARDQHEDLQELHSFVLAAWIHTALVGRRP